MTMTFILYYLVAGFVVATLMGIFHKKLKQTFGKTLTINNQFDGFELFFVMFIWPLVIIEGTIWFFLLSVKLVFWLIENYVTYITNIIK